LKKHKEQDMAHATVDEVVRGYIKLRDKKNQLKKEQAEELRPITEKMVLLENWLLRDLQTRKVESQKTAEGTAFLSTSAAATVKDRDAFFKYVIDNEQWDLLENRVSKTVVRDHLEDTGEVVPGVHYQETQVVRIRR
jgi:hypothetical protein